MRQIGSLLAQVRKAQDISMQVLSNTKVPDCRDVVSKHPFGAEHLVLGNLLDQPSQDRAISARTYAAVGCQLPHGLAYPAETNAINGRT